MHSYLRAIGFSKIKNRRDLNKILNLMIENPSNIDRTSKYEDIIYAEISTSYSKDMGITIRGEYDTDNVFHIEHYFPYLTGNLVSSREEVGINKRVETEAYTGMADDFRVGVSLIFYIQNVVEYLEKRNKKMDLNTAFDISLSALSLAGRILLPVAKTEKQKKKTISDNNFRNNLIAEAKRGNQEAIESLTIDDIDTFAMVSKRIKSEDIYSIVESSFIPFGSESDNYSILGTITDVEKVENSLTKEEVYILTLSCNGIEIKTCINKEDLIGEPEEGRRFKGNIWLQGKISFS